MKSDSTFDKYFAQFSNQDLKEAQTIQQDLVKYSVFKTEELNNHINERNIKILDNLKKRLNYSKRQSQMSDLTYTFREIQKEYYKNNPILKKTKETFKTLHKFGASLAHKHLNAQFSLRDETENEQFSKMMKDAKSRKRAFEKQREKENTTIREYQTNTNIDKNKIVTEYQKNRENRFAQQIDKENFDGFKQKISEIITNNNKTNQIGQLREKEIEDLKRYYSKTSVKRPTETKNIKDKGKKNPIYEKIRRTVATELNAAYNIERVSTYLDEGVKYVRWNLLPEHTTASSDRSGFAIGVVCERCFSRANGGLDNLGIYVIEDVITDPNLYIPQHPYCGCFYKPIYADRLEKGGVVLKDGQGNKIVNTTFSRLKDYENYITTFPSAGKSDAQAFIEKSAIGLGALYLFLNKPAMAKKLNLSSFKDIQDVITGAISLEKINATLSKTARLIKEVSKETTQIISKNKDDFFNYTKERSSEVSQINTRLQRQLNEEAEELEKNQDNRPVVGLPETRQQLPELKKESKSEELQETEETELIRLPKQNSLPELSKKQSNTFKIFKKDVDDNIADQKIPEIQKNIENKINQIKEVIDDFQNNFFPQIKRYKKQETEQLTTEYFEYYSNYQRLIAELDNLLLDYNSAKMGIINELRNTATDNNIEWNLSQVVELLDEYQINTKQINYNQSAKKVKSEKINKLFAYVEDQLNEVVVLKISNNIGDDVLETDYSEIINESTKIIKRIQNNIKNGSYFTASENLKNNSELFKELNELLKESNERLSLLPVGSNNLSKIAKNYTGERRVKLERLAELKKQQEKLGKINYDVFDLQHSVSKQSSYFDKVEKNLVDEPFLTPTEKVNMTTEKTNVTQKGFIDYVINQQNKVKDFIIEVFNKEINSESDLDKLFQSTRQNKKKYRNIKTILSQYAESNLSVLLLYNEELINKWTNKKIRPNLNEFLLDVKKNRSNMDENLTNLQKERISTLFAQRKRELKRREFQQKYTNFANFTNKIDSILYD